LLIYAAGYYPFLYNYTIKLNAIFNVKHFCWRFQWYIRRGCISSYITL
jgi:hypothetical protein